jgi:hypothetical protein
MYCVIIGDFIKSKSINQLERKSVQEKFETLLGRTSITRCSAGEIA